MGLRGSLRQERGGVGAPAGLSATRADKPVQADVFAAPTEPNRLWAGGGGGNICPLLRELAAASLPNDLTHGRC